MKTINYKNANVMKTLVAAVIIMTSFSGIARGANSNQDSIGTIGNESVVEAQSWTNGVEYNAADFVAIEMAIETEMMNNSTETISNTFEAELALQVKYNAADFVATEIAIETESRMNHNTCPNVSEFHINCGYVLASK